MPLGYIQAPPPEASWENLGSLQPTPQGYHYLLIMEIHETQSVNGLNINDSEKRTPGFHLPPPRGNIHVYYHIIKASKKPLGQSKPNFI